MDSEEFRAALARLGITKAELARVLQRLGDPAAAATIRRRVERWGDGSNRIPGEAIALLAMLERHGVPK